MVGAQIDDDLAGGVWEKMDAADPRSPFASFSLPCGKKESKRGDDGGGRYARVEEEEDEAAVAAADTAEAAADENALLWRMWRVTKPLVISQGLWQLVATLTEFVPSVAMQQIIDFVSAYDKGEEGVTGRITLFVVLLFAGPVVQGIADGRNFHLGRRIGCRVGKITIFFHGKPFNALLSTVLYGVQLGVCWCVVLISVRRKSVALRSAASTRTYVRASCRHHVCSVRDH